jgi:hypothetical protein
MAAAAGMVTVIEAAGGGILVGVEAAIAAGSWVAVVGGSVIDTNFTATKVYSQKLRAPVFF